MSLVIHPDQDLPAQPMHPGGPLVTQLSLYLAQGKTNSGGIETPDALMVPT